jgi:hypothetical protein
MRKLWRIFKAVYGWTSSVLITLMLVGTVIGWRYAPTVHVVSMLPPMHAFAAGDCVSVKGVQAAAAGEKKLAHPWNAVELTCWKPARTCRYALAEISDSGMLSVETFIYNIRSWGAAGGGGG